MATPPPLAMMPSSDIVLDWDVVNWSKALCLWEPHVMQGSLDCLELGCGRGGVSLWLASKGNHVLCSDVCEPLDAVRELHRLYGVSDLVEYQAIDAMFIPYVSKFDVIVVKSVLGGILGRNGEEGLHKTISEICKALKPGGKLLFAENLHSSRFHMFCRRKFLGRVTSVWAYPTLKEMLKFLSPFAAIDYQTAGFLGTFGRKEWQRTLLAYADKALKPVLPIKLRYVVAGVAVK